jgi:hypothetical protein
MSPKAVYLDFEQALADGFVKVSPGATPLYASQCEESERGLETGER